MSRNINTQQYADGKVTVVLSTYNGSKYLEELLESLLNQTWRIDEVLISDDCSTDNTTEIIERFILKHDLTTWIFEKNEENKGWKRNFKDLFSRAKHEYIFPCDQDDIWNNDKIESMISIMKDNRDILLLVSDYTPFGEYKTKEIDSGAKEDVCKADFNNFLKIIRPGCVFCFRKELSVYLDEYAFDEYPHDAFIWRTACMLDGLYFYNKSTIKYRRHAETATGREKKSAMKKLNAIDYYEKVLDSAELFLKNVANNDFDKQKDIQRYREWLYLRKNLISQKKICSWVKLFKYFDCYYSVKMYLGDLIFAIKRKSQ